LAEAYKGLVPNQNELHLLGTALTRMFESTRYLDDTALFHVLAALGTLSLSCLANATHVEVITTGSDGSSGGGSSTSGAGGSGATQAKSGGPLSLRPPPMRMFALVNLLATVEHNMFRIAHYKVFSFVHLHDASAHLLCFSCNSCGILWWVI
jgi:hypothetical protein